MTDATEGTGIVHASPPSGTAHGVPRTPAEASMLSRGQAVRLGAAGLCLIAACYGLARFAYGLFVPAFGAAFDLDAATTGAIASGSYGAYCLGILLATSLTPRWGARVVATAAGILATLGTALIALAPGALVLAVGVMIAGSSTGVASPPLAHAIAHRVKPAARNSLQTVVNAGTGAGVMVSGPIALMAQDQWRLAWAAFAVLSAAVTVWIAVTVPSVREPGTQAQRPGTPESSTPAGSDQGGLSALGNLVKLPRGAVRLLAAAGVMGAASAANWTFGQELLSSAGGHGQVLSTVAWIVLGACGLFGAAAGQLTDRFGIRPVWTGLMIILGGASGLLAVSPQHGAAALIANGVFGGVYIALTGLLLVWSTRIFEHEPAKGVGLAFLFIAIGQAAASPVLGGLADLSSLPAVFGLAAGLALAGSVLGPRRSRPREDSAGHGRQR
ncbi:MFS transporter [Citricoccus sp. GCM10030269]|uniref:MFS transporter n=1 Tax=Citricoccus sp. GCM10030269 TaxID=3273388 RepID=UPI0036097225